jgi:hypothetical protein
LLVFRLSPEDIVNAACAEPELAGQVSVVCSGELLPDSPVPQLLEGAVELPDLDGLASEPEREFQRGFQADELNQLAGLALNCGQDSIQRFLQ